VTEFASVQRRPLFLHVGCRKSGTSALQRVLKDSRTELLAQGVGLPFATRPQHVRNVHAPLAAIEAGEAEQGNAGIGALVQLLLDFPGDRLVLTLEDLAEVADEAAEALVRALVPHFDLHVVVTARDWSKQIPSEWQQAVKSRLTLTYPEFAAAVRESRPAGADFWRRQYVPGIARKWGGTLPPDHVHIIAVPSLRQDPVGTYRLFGGLVGFDVDSLEISEGSGNRSLGYEQAEVLRRVNVALGKRLLDVREEYRPAVRQLLINGALRWRWSAPPSLLPEDAEWCRQVCQEMLGELRAAGYDLLGDPGDLLPPEHMESTHQEVSDERLAEVAIMALADAAYNAHVLAETRRAERQLRRSRVQRPPRAEPARPPADRRLRMRLAGIARAVRGWRTR
jgi:hypothetical protein